MPPRIPLHYRRFAALHQIRPSSSSSHIPRIAQPSLWSGIIPRFLQPSYYAVPASARNPHKVPWHANPATPILILAMLCGSQAVHNLRLKREMLAMRRSTEAKLDLLKGLIERVQAGEEVDIKKELGTGDEVAEREWADVIRDLEDDFAWKAGNSRERREEKRRAKRAERAGRREARSAEQAAEDEKGGGEVKIRRGPAFY